MAGQKQRWHEILQDDEIHGAKSKCVAREANDQPITTWRRPLGEKVIIFQSRRSILYLAQTQTRQHLMLSGHVRSASL